MRLVDTMGTAVCARCSLALPVDNFQRRSDRSGKFRTVCRSCRADGQRERYAKYKNDSFFLYKATRARSRSQSLRVPFDLDAEYLESIWTGKCPALGIELRKNTDRSDEHAAELDRFIPELGYVRGNVTFLSRKANRIKNNCSVEELGEILDWMKNYGKN